MIVRVDPSSATPPYEQIRFQVAEMVSTGVLAEDSRLPTIRQLAGDLGVAEGTISRAYRELEREGWIRPRGRHGTFVRRPSTATAPDRERLLRDAAAAFATRVRQTGADPQDALQLVREALGSMPA
jgi:DNA-binding transcriptional regulator YhcF (GntR family)